MAKKSVLKMKLKSYFFLLIVILSCENVFSGTFKVCPGNTTCSTNLLCPDKSIVREEDEVKECGVMGNLGICCQTWFVFHLYRLYLFCDIF